VNCSREFREDLRREMATNASELVATRASTGRPGVERPLLERPWRWYVLAELIEQHEVRASEIRRSLLTRAATTADPRAKKSGACRLPRLHQVGVQVASCVSTVETSGLPKHLRNTWAHPTTAQSVMSIEHDGSRDRCQSNSEHGSHDSSYVASGREECPGYN
jgi:hypothetical protein